MENVVAISKVQFHNFKAFPDFALSLRDVNVLVGPNNSGKSTILNAFRILASGIRRARAYRADRVTGIDGDTYGHYISTEELPFSFENVHTNYDRDKQSFIVFTLSNRNTLTLYFPEPRACILIPKTAARSAMTPTTFRTEFPLEVDFVPVLGPVEHDEDRVEERTVQRNLQTHRASRNFRNFWRFNAGMFDEFAHLLAQTWPGMAIQPPEGIGPENKIYMFCMEHENHRELYWSGFGFQVWCQLLTHIVRAKRADYLVVDEPEIYLHPDLQRQLLSILRSAGPKLLLATHSTEIIAEAEPDEILIVDKSKRSAQRLRRIDQVQDAIERLGSSQNITLTQLARTRRVLFVEGNDFRLLSQFAGVLNLPRVKTQSNFTVVPSDGFSNWSKIDAFSWGFKQTMKQSLDIGAVFDRDYRCDEEIDEIVHELSGNLRFVHFHSRKELENYLLVPVVLEKAIKQRLIERATSLDFHIDAVLEEITNPLKSSVSGSYLGARVDYFRKRSSGIATSTVSTDAMENFERRWSDISLRMEIVPGKEVFSKLNAYLQDNYRVSLTPFQVVRNFNRFNVPKDLVTFLRKVDSIFCAPLSSTGEDSLSD